AARAAMAASAWSYPTKPSLTRHSTGDKPTEGQRPMVTSPRLFAVPLMAFTGCQNTAPRSGGEAGPCDLVGQDSSCYMRRLAWLSRATLHAAVAELVDALA